MLCLLSAHSCCIMSFRSESIGNILKELKQEKEALQSKLAQLRSKRRETETANENISSKLLHTRELNEKMQETRKLAQHKETQTQALSSSYETEIQQLRQRTSEINKNIEEEEQKKMSELQQFEEALSQVKDKLLWGKQFFTNDCLQRSIETSEKERCKLQEKASDFKSEDESLCHHLELLQVTTLPKEGFDVPQETRNLLGQLIQQELENVEAKLEDITKCFNEAQRVVTELLAA